ncbi:hypothetical protein D7W82_37075 [Corallococcus sp. CA049B]|nr:hypothetical protein D7W82_37075 [Corallococcus sp. CA049B]
MLAPPVSSLSDHMKCGRAISPSQVYEPFWLWLTDDAGLYVARRRPFTRPTSLASVPDQVKLTSF